jgi:hypothetical protein
MCINVRLPAREPRYPAAVRRNRLTKRERSVKRSWRRTLRSACVDGYIDAWIHAMGETPMPRSGQGH